MTGFARSAGQAGATAWAWELRSVNGRGLDLRFRLPPGCDALEPGLREVATKALTRGNVTANLTIRQEAAGRLIVDQAALEQVLALATALAARIPGSAPPQAEALLALPGIVRAGGGEPAESDSTALHQALRAGFAEALAGLCAARAEEGLRMGQVLGALLEEIAALRDQAAMLASGQPEAQRARMIQTVTALLGEIPTPPAERIAQEVALLAARADVREELDRLESHIAAARALLAEGVKIGRRFDFLVQEFNREANTLCSKSASAGLTAVGLKLKAAIEQMREQVQNIE
ncbi:MAG: YicC family protein [Rhodospirillales bacterium]|nr:YicC family protein [Rhodospirillales bacterium]